MNGDIKGQESQVKQISNAALAMVLHMCGVPFAKVDGVTIPGFNLYSDAFLKQKGYEKQSREVAIRELWNKGTPGNIVYQFQRVEDSPLIGEIIKGWDKMASAIDKADSADPDAIVGTLEGVDAATVAAICCQFAKTRRMFFGDRETVPLWRKRDAKWNLFIPACKAPEGPSRTEHHGATTIYYSSMELKSVKV